MTCAKCGTVNDPGRVYCVYCGEELRAPAAPPPPPPPPAGRRIPVVALVAGALVVVIAGVALFALKGGAPSASPAPTAAPSIAALPPTPSPSAGPTLTPSPSVAASPAAVPIPNRPIAFAGTTNLFVIQPTGGTAKQLTATGANVGPAWSFGATKIAWNRIVSGDPVRELWVMNANGSSAHVLTKAANTNKAPSWSPDGTQIAFVAKYGTTIPQIWTMPAAGGKPVKMTSASSGATEPSWSPDGHAIVYVVAEPGHLDLWRLDPDQPSVAPVQLTKPASGSDNSPNWSPDGTKIAFDSTRDGTDRIYVMNADGSDIQVLSAASLDAAWPVWSPDGSQIAFQVTKGSGTDLYVMPAAGGTARDITPNAGQQAFNPAWW